MSVEGRARSYSVPSLCATHVSTIQNISSTGSYSAEIKELFKRKQEQLNQLGEQLYRLQNPPKRYHVFWILDQWCPQ